MSFHTVYSSGDSWFFERLATGRVRIIKRSETGWIEAKGVIEPEDWALLTAALEGSAKEATATDEPTPITQSGAKVTA